MKTLSFALKRLLDVLVAGLGLLVLSPLLVPLALLIRLDSPGPALFRQGRLGLRRKPFQCYKFRTMRQNAPDLRNPDGTTFNAADDPRVTRTGRFLRRTSLDELPQLINVLKGEMSLVGPRPDMLEQISLYEPGDFRRLEVKPGITGWAQIHGRNSVPLPQRRALDIEYVERFSFWLDLKILLLTIPAWFFSRNIYTDYAQKED